MQIGIPKETLREEKRVGLAPAGVDALVKSGHTVFVETEAGLGSHFSDQEFINAGGFKSNIELTFQYELLLRMLNNGAVIYTIPKVGYMHLAVREDSLFNKYSKTLTLNQRKFWFNVAKKEYSFFADREIDLSLLDTSTPQK